MESLEICAGAGGQALGLHQARFEHAALVEIDAYACQTLRENNAALGLGWGEVIEDDLKNFVAQRAAEFAGRIDLVAGGVPCPPFSYAGKRLGKDDERDLFPDAINLVRIVRPRAVMLENVPGLMSEKFSDYRNDILKSLADLGYEGGWRLFQASNFGVPQLRPRAILVALRREFVDHFHWPEPTDNEPQTVGEALFEIMASRGWEGVYKWRERANQIAPTLVGGSKKHGGPDLGPTRAKKKWQSLGVNPLRVGGHDEIPGPGFNGVLQRNGTIKPGYENMPLLTVQMGAILQGFPENWQFHGSKTHAWRQVGNAFPPPVACAIGRNIYHALDTVDQENQGRIPVQEQLAI